MTYNQVSHTTHMICPLLHPTPRLSSLIRLTSDITLHLYEFSSSTDQVIAVEHGTGVLQRLQFVVEVVDLLCYVLLKGDVPLFGVLSNLSLVRSVLYVGRVRCALCNVNNLGRNNT